MQDTLIELTIVALMGVTNPQYYLSERGFQGEFYATLRNQLERAGHLGPRAVLEAESQKSARIHGTSQRPDVILHRPRGDGEDPSTTENVAVWAFKRRASRRSARLDFAKLDTMFQKLRYTVGFFINIDATEPYAEEYVGSHSYRLCALAVTLEDGVPNVRVGRFS